MILFRLPSKPTAHLLRSSASAIFSAVVSAAVLAAAGCELLSPRRPVAVVIPDGDFARLGLPEPERWEVSWLSEGGVCGRTVAAGGRFALSLPKERPTLVIARPETGGVTDLWKAKPAGFAAAAGDPPSGEIRLAWEEGFAAWYLLHLAETGIDPEAINIRRFLDTVRSRGGENPWDLDRRALGEDLYDGDLWVYSFRLPDREEVDIPLPEGTWFSEYLPSAPLVAGPEGWTGNLGVGIHAYLRGEDGAAAVVDVDEGGWTALLVSLP